MLDIDYTSPPDWRPLRALVGAQRLDEFTYLGKVARSGMETIYMYKHKGSHNYLNVTKGRRTYRWPSPSDEYELIPVLAALEHVLPGFRGLSHVY